MHDDQQTDKRGTLRLPPSAMKQLQALATINKRSATQQAIWIIEQEAKAANIPL